MFALPPAIGNADMGLYYFDLRDGEELFVDEEGIEMSDLEAAQMEAARSLADMAKHAVWSRAEAKLGHRMAVEVRDTNGPVLQATFTFEIEKHKR